MLRKHSHSHAHVHAHAHEHAQGPCEDRTRRAEAQSLGTKPAARWRAVSVACRILPLLWRSFYRHAQPSAPTEQSCTPHVVAGQAARARAREHTVGCIVRDLLKRSPWARVVACRILCVCASFTGMHGQQPQQNTAHRGHCAQRNHSARCLWQDSRKSAGALPKLPHDAPLRLARSSPTSFPSSCQDASFRSASIPIQSSGLRSSCAQRVPGVPRCGSALIPKFPPRLAVRRSRSILAPPVPPSGPLPRVQF